MEDFVAIIVSNISLGVSLIGMVFNIFKDKRDNAELSVTWDNKTVWT